MKKFSAFVLAMLGATVLRAEAVIDQVIVRQQWPWSTDIKVEYRISGAESPVSLGVEAWNGGVPLDSAKLHEAISGTLYGIKGDVVGEFTIDPVKAFGDTGYVALANFKVKLTVSDDPNADEVLYKIYDLTAETGAFPCTDVTRADLLNGKYGAIETDFGKVGAGFSTDLQDVLVWTGVTNYPGATTTKLVMRKIPKGTFSMGQTGGTFGTTGNAEPVHNVTLTKDFYIGVFELTQEQYRRLQRSSYSGSHNVGDANPIENASYDAYRSQVTSVFRTNLGVDTLDFPTEAQWEKACRAGTTSELYNGKALSINGQTQSGNIAPIAWYAEEGTHEVGLKLPNAFGLYDMLGNVYEACVDWYGTYAAGDATDPTGPDTAPADSKRVIRGGYYSTNNYLITSAGRSSSSGGWINYGFRLAFTVAD